MRVAFSAASDGTGCSPGTSFCSVPDVHVEHTNFTSNDGAIGAVGADLFVKECNFINNIQTYWGGGAIHNRFGR